MLSDLQLRLILTHLGVLLAALVLLGIAFSLILTDRVTAAHQSDLRYETSALATQLDTMLAKNVRKTAIQRLIRRDSELMGKRIILLDPHGQVRYDSSRWTSFSRGSWRLIDLAALHRGRSASMESSDHFGVQAPLVVHGSVAGAVALLITSAATTPTWQQILPALLAVFGLVLLAWVALGAYLTRSLIRPLRQVSDALVLARGGRYDRPVPEEGWSEARGLARRYNEMVAQVARSRQIQRDFMVNAAHELKTPVALVAGFSRSLKDGSAEREGAVGEAVDYIQTESEHLARVVDQLFALASLDADTDPLVLSPCQPALLAREVLDRFSRRAEAEKKVLQFESPSLLPQCVWDTQRMASALTNLVSNAFDYTIAGGTIVVTADFDGREIVLSVRDSGCGIATHDVPHVFDRFYRGSGSRRVQGHAGLGLAMVQEVVQRHHGTVAVDSCIGEGTCFTLALPPRVEGANETVLDYAIARPDVSA